MGSTEVFYCPSCSTWRRTLSTRASRNDKLETARRNPHVPATTRTRRFTTSPTISAGKTVPRRFKELYDALSGVKDAAIEQVSLSRLSLALRGLESEEPLIRVAGEYLQAWGISSPIGLLLIGLGTDINLRVLVLGLDNADAARKLVRLLLADPLGPREGWEDVLEGYDSDPSRGLLIRYVAAFGLCSFIPLTACLNV